MKTVKDLEDHGLEVAIIRSNTVSQMKAFLMASFGLHDQKDEEDSAMNEVTDDIDTFVERSVEDEPVGRGSAGEDVLPGLAVDRVPLR